MSESIAQNPFGISREEILNLAAQKIADQYCSDGDELQDHVTKLIAERIKGVFAESLTARINAFMDAEMETLVKTQIVPVDIWGDAKGEPTTIRESLAAKAVAYWNERVNCEGRTSDSYGAKCRHEWLFQKIVGEEFERGIRQNIINLVAAFKDAIREDEKKKIDTYLNEFLRVKSHGDK